MSTYLLCSYLSIEPYHDHDGRGQNRRRDKGQVEDVGAGFTAGNGNMDAPKNEGLAFHVAISILMLRSFNSVVMNNQDLEPFTKLCFCQTHWKMLFVSIPGLHGPQSCVLFSAFVPLRPHGFVLVQLLVLRYQLISLHLLLRCFQVDIHTDSLYSRSTSAESCLLIC